MVEVYLPEPRSNIRRMADSLRPADCSNGRHVEMHRLIGPPACRSSQAAPAPLQACRVCRKQRNVRYHRH